MMISFLKSSLSSRMALWMWNSPRSMKIQGLYVLFRFMNLTFFLIEKESNSTSMMSKFICTISFHEFSHFFFNRKEIQLQIIGIEIQPSSYYI